MNVLFDRIDDPARWPESVPVHHDAAALGDRLEWYALLARHVPAANERVVLSQVRRPGTGEQATLPLLIAPGALAGLSNYYLPDYRPICSALSAVPLVTDALLATLAELRPATARFANVDATAPELDALESALIRHGMRVRQEPGTVNWTDTAVGQGYEHWLSVRPGRVRSTLARRGRRFSKLPGARLEIVDSARGIEPAIDGWQAVYARSWKPAEAYPAFMPDLIRWLADDGSLRLGIAWLGELPIAMQLWIVRRRVAFIYKLAHDDVHAGHSAGTLLFGALAKHAIERDGIERLDFLSGDDAYKADWTSDRGVKRTLLGFDIRTSAGLRALLRHDLGRARTALRARLLQGSRFDP